MTVTAPWGFGTALFGLGPFGSPWTFAHAPVASPSVDGATVSYGTPNGPGPGNGDAIPADSVLLVRNGSASTVTVTVNATISYEDFPISSPTVNIPAGTEVAIGPFPRELFMAGGTDLGFVYIDYSSITSITRAVVNLP